MMQQGQVFELNPSRGDGRTLWAYRYRTGGRTAKRIQRGGFASEQDARAALERALERLRRRQNRGRMLTLSELVEQYLCPARGLAGHAREAALAAHARRGRLWPASARRVGPARDRCLANDDQARVPLRGHTGAAAGVAARHRLGAARRQPAKLGVENPQRRPTEKRPFESWDDVEAVAARLRGCLGPMVIFAAATGLRPGEWVALEQRDLDRDARVVYVRRSFGRGRLKCTKTETSVRAVPLQAIALSALDQVPAGGPSDLLFPAVNGGYLDLHNFRNRDWKPAQRTAGIEPFRRIYDLRHTFATFALRAGISTFDLSRYMGASLTMIDRHYGHLARDGREHAIRLLDDLNDPAVDTGGRSVDAEPRRRRRKRQPKRLLSRQ